MKEITPIIKKTNTTDEKYDPNELKMGVEIEHEHKNLYDLFKSFCDKHNLEMPISDTEMYGMITKVHLDEIEDYNTKLKEMEREAGSTEDKEKEKKLEASLNKFFLFKRSLEEAHKYVLITYVDGDIAKYLKEKVVKEKCYNFSSKYDDVDAHPYERAGMALGPNQAVFHAEDSPYLPPESQTIANNLRNE